MIAIAEAAQALVAARDTWLATGTDPGQTNVIPERQRTLTNLYNHRPDWLTLLHRQLDDAVADAYGWPHDLSDADVLERMLALNGVRHTANISV